MSETVIQVESLWKQYRLGIINHHTLTRDLQSCWARMSGKEDPNSPIGSGPFQSEDRFWALKNVSFEVKQGDVLGIIGRNGAGKSTLLKILSQVTAPTKGEVRFKGRISSLLEVGTGFHPELTGRENIFLNGAILGMRKMEIRRKFDEIVDFAEVEKFIDTPVKRYSSGMYVRLAFAVAANLEPEILVVDEVLAVGDAAFQRKCLGKMSAVANEGRTVLFVSHNMPTIQHLCSRAILLKSGEIINQGDTRSVIDEYIAICIDNTSNIIDLTNHSKRIKGATPFFSSIAIRVDGQPSNTPRMGQGMEIVLLYNYHIPVKGLRIGVTINDSMNRRIVSFSPSHQNPLALENAEGKGEIICKIPSMNLVSGIYSLTVIAGDNTGDIDRIEECCTIQILPDDVFNTGKTPTRQHGFVYLAADWQLKSIQ